MASNTYSVDDLVPFARTIDKIGAVTLRANKLLTTQAAVAAYIEQLTAENQELHGFEGALVDVVNTEQDDVVEIYASPDQLANGHLSSTNGIRVLFMPEIGRAALNTFQAGDWSWTDAQTINEAFRRYLADDMRP